MKLQISYKNSLIGSLSAGESIALHLNGQKLTEDLVVRAVNANLISFTIDGETYYAEEGMTWGEWVESEYNTNGYTISPDGVVLAGSLITYVELGEKSRREIRLKLCA
jgi:hypothetical protein